MDPVTGAYAPMADEPPVDQAALADVDRLTAPDRVRTHQPHPLSRWACAVAVPAQYAIGGLLVVAFFAPASLALSLAVAAVACGLGLVVGWRQQVRPYLRWNAGGLVALVDGETVEVTWSPEITILADGSHVLVVEPLAETIVLVRARRRMALLPAAPGERTADQLLHALRLARQQAVALPLPVPGPEPMAQRLPLQTLLALWAPLTAATTAALYWLSRMG